MIFQRWLVRAFWQSDGLGNLLTLWIDPFSKSEQKIIWVKFRAFAGKGEKLPCGELLIDGGAVEPISFINQTIHQSRKQVMGLTCCVVKTMILMALTQYHRKYYCCTKFCTFELQLNCVFGPRLRVNLRRINEIWKGHQCNLPLSQALLLMNTFYFHTVHIDQLSGKKGKWTSMKGPRSTRYDQIQRRALICVGRRDRDQLSKFGRFLLSYCSHCTQKIVQ